MNNNIIIPLDLDSTKKNIRLAESLEGEPGIYSFKVNDELFDEGTKIVKSLKPFGKVFADAKINEIPQSTSRIVGQLMKASPNLITVHASSDINAIKAAVETAGDEAKILVVTILTSYTEERCQETFGGTITEKVVQFAHYAKKAGAYGIICPPRQILEIKKYPGLSVLKLFVPGIRPINYTTKDDQRNILTPFEAMVNGADFLIIGRPIIFSSNPKKALRLIWEEVCRARKQIAL